MDREDKAFGTPSKGQGYASGKLNESVESVDRQEQAPTAQSAFGRSGSFRMQGQRVPSGGQGQLAAEDIKKVIEEKIETANRQQMDEMKKLILEMGGKQMQQSQKYKDQQA
jgi:hypothetical protein